MIVYVGRSAAPEEIRTVAACKWSAVITIRTEPEFSLWYGYLPRSLFYVKRCLEDPLVQLVWRMLAGRGIENEHRMLAPIILEGDPGIPFEIRSVTFLWPVA